MKVEELKLARWFKNRLKTIMKHYGYGEEQITAKECDKTNNWTPCDLIAREYLNNGGGSARGFLGISPSECVRCYDYMCENNDYLIMNDLVNERATNNSGFTLWTNWNF